MPNIDTRLYFYAIFTILICIFKEITAQNRCYSCASKNMQVNFLNKPRGPQKRITLPKVFDNMCDIDTWMIKNKALVDCQGPCFKWQEIVNNSGVYSYMTIRDCYTRMFDLTNPQTIQPPNHSSCTNREKNLECLADASLLDSFCWCFGDQCNFGVRSRPYLIILVSSLCIVLFILTKK